MVNLLLCVRWPLCVHSAALCVAPPTPTLWYSVRRYLAHRPVVFRAPVRWGPLAGRVRTAPLYGAQRPHPASSEAASALPPSTGRSVRILSPQLPSVPVQHPPFGWGGLNTLNYDYKILKFNQ